MLEYNLSYAMADWKTTKIKADVKARAKDDDRTYTEIMADGLAQDSGSDDISVQDIEDLKNEISMANEPGVQLDVDSIMSRLEAVEGKLADLQTTVNTVKERIPEQ